MRLKSRLKNTLRKIAPGHTYIKLKYFLLIDVIRRQDQVDFSIRENFSFANANCIFLSILNGTFTKVDQISFLIIPNPVSLN